MGDVARCAVVSNTSWSLQPELESGIELAGVKPGLNSEELLTLDALL
jgi:hypothetical protein